MRQSLLNLSRSKPDIIFSMFMQLRGSFLTLKKKEGEATEWTLDGVDQISGSNVEDIKKIYTEEGVDPNQSPSDPLAVPMESDQFSSLKIELGISINF